MSSFFLLELDSLFFGEGGFIGSACFLDELDEELDDFFFSSSNGLVGSVGGLVGSVGGFIGESLEDELDDEDFCLITGGSFSDSLELLED